MESERKKTAALAEEKNKRKHCFACEKTKPAPPSKSIFRLYRSYLSTRSALFTLLTHSLRIVLFLSISIDKIVMVQPIPITVHSLSTFVSPNQLSFRQTPLISHIFTNSIDT